MTRPHFKTWTDQRSGKLLDVVAATGPWFELEGGQKIYDFCSGSFHVNWGYNNPTIIAAIREQMDQLACSRPDWEFSLKTNVSSRLLSLLGLEGKIFYTLSGSESVENALKISRTFTGRKKVLAMQSSYHGATLGAISVTGDWRNKENMTVDDWTLRCPSWKDDPDAHQLKAIVEENQDQIAALIIESVSGVNGVHRPPASWLKKVDEILKKNSILWILDEVLSGFYRCGKPFALQDFSIQPDLVCMAKGISGGHIPFGALFVNDNVASYFEDNILACGLTCYAHPLGLAAVKGVLEVIGSKTFGSVLQENITSLTRVVGKMRKLPSVCEIRQEGLLVAIVFRPHSKALDFDFLNEKALSVKRKENYLLLAPIVNGENKLLSEKLEEFYETVEFLGRSDVS